MGRTSDAREKLLAVAFQLIWDSSYGGVSVDQICEKAGVNKGSFYHFFGTKASLAVEAYEQHWKLQQPEMDRLFSAQLGPLERLSLWCSFVYQCQKQKALEYGRVCGCPYASIGGELATQDNEIRSKSAELMARNTKYLETTIAEAQRLGLAGAPDVKAAAQQVNAFVLGTVLSAKIQNDLEVLRNLEPTVMAIIDARVAVSL